MASTPTPEQLTNRLAGELPEKLKCVVLFGSAAAGDFVPGVSNYNVLVVTDPLTTAELRALHKPIAAWTAAGHPSPLLFSTQELSSVGDVFPIELLDIRQSRRVLWGDDLLAAVRIEPCDLRLQIERELLGQLLKLRAHYVLAADKPDAVRDLMLSSSSTFLVLFRAALRLYQDAVPDTKPDALHALAQHITFDVRPFERLLQSKHARSDPAGGEVAFTDYLSAIEHVAHAISHLNHPTPGAKHEHRPNTPG